MTKKDLLEINEKIKVKRKGFLFKNFTKYIVDYRKDEDNLIVISSNGETRKVKNTKSNVAKLNKEIVKSKVDIAKRIDEYERESQNRTVIFAINIISLLIAGLLVPFTLFTGIYALFFASIILFSFLVITSTMLAFNNYALVSEIRNLKKITGYKKENEFELPKLNIVKTR